MLNIKKIVFGKRIEPADKAYVIIVMLIRLTLLFAMGRAIFTKDWMILFVSLITFIMSFSTEIFEKKKKIDIPVELEIATVLFIYAALFLGEVRNYYTRFWWWDAVLHAGSAMAIGFIGFIILFILYKRKKVTAHPLIIALFSFLFALGMGAVWEIFEFGMDNLFGMNMQKSGLMDTMWDLIVDAAGALITAVSGYFYLKKKSSFFKGMIERMVKRNPDIFSKT